MNPSGREKLEVDVLFVGAGPASLSGALHLARLCRGRSVTIAVVEKSRELGGHLVSGAILDPIALAELVPAYLDEAPIESAVKRDDVVLLTGASMPSFRSLKIPALLVPPEMKHRTGLVISVARFCRWLGKLASESGVQILTGVSAVEVLWEGDRVAGVRTADHGLDKEGRPKAAFQPGVEVRAKVTVFGEGPKGTLSEKVIDRFGLREGQNPPMYSLGVKEVVELPHHRLSGRVLHTLGYPLDAGEFGGGFLYGMSGNLVSLGLVVGMDWTDPGMDPQVELQRWKGHPFIRALLSGGRVLEYGSRMIPEGGYFSVPRLSSGGALLVGDAAGLVNIPRLKGIHLGMKSGMLAAETIQRALESRDFSAPSLARYDEKVRSSFIMRELRRSRNFRQVFQSGLASGLFRSQVHRVFGGRFLRDRLPVREPISRLREAGTFSRPAPSVPYDGTLVIDKRTALFLSGTSHDETAPAHMRIPNAEFCRTCHERYGSPCTKFCPANVYAWNEEERRIVLSPANCLHPRACEPGCPFGNILWNPPEGGSGPRHRLT